MTNQSDQNNNISNQASKLGQEVSNQAENIADRAEQATEQVANQVENVPNQVSNQAEHVSDHVSDQVQSAKSAVTQPLPTPDKTSGGQASASELLKRLNWGEPALTIIDARSRDAFNAERITGAMSRDQVFESPESTLEYQRDIYVYGDDSNQASEVASQLRETGFQNVALVQGGLSAWKAIGGPTEGVEAFASPAGAKV